MKKAPLLYLLFLMTLSSCMTSYAPNWQIQFLDYPNESISTEIEVIEQGQDLPNKTYFVYDKIEFATDEEKHTKEEMVEILKSMAQYKPHVDGIILTDLAYYEEEVPMSQENPGFFIALAVLGAAIDEDGSAGGYDPLVTVEKKSLVAYPFVYLDNEKFNSVLKRIEIHEESELISENKNYFHVTPLGSFEKDQYINEFNRWVLMHTDYNLVHEFSDKWEFRINDNGQLIRKRYENGYVSYKVKLFRDNLFGRIERLEVRDKNTRDLTRIKYLYDNDRLSGRILESPKYGVFTEDYIYDTQNKISEVTIYSHRNEELIKLNYLYYTREEIIQLYPDNLFNAGDFITD